MKRRKLALGNRNIVGARVTEARKALGMKQVELLAQLQLRGVDLSVPALSLLEGQKRPVSDIELNALADKGASFISVEMSNGQMADDVRLAISCRRPVELVNRLGGNLITLDQVMGAIKKMAK